MTNLIQIAQQYTTWMGSIIFIVGLLGNSMLLFVFTKERAYRTNPCTFYFFVGTLHDFLLVFIILGLRIVPMYFGFDLSQRSVVWCRVRYYLFATWASIALTCQCLAAIDQFLITSKSARLRRLSNMKVAYRSVIIAIVVWWIHSIPWLFYQDISARSGTCIYTNPIFLQYVILFILIVLCLIPMLVMGLFGVLAFANMVNTTALNQQNAHRQTTLMVCAQSFFVIISGIFNSAWNIYVLITYQMAKDFDRLSLEYLIQSFIILLPYLIASDRFYIFLAVSSRFRQLVWKVIGYKRANNQVSTARNVATISTHAAERP